MVLIGWPVVDAVWGFLRSPEFSAIGSIATLGGLWLAWKAIVDGKTLSKNLRDVEKSLSICVSAEIYLEALNHSKKSSLQSRVRIAASE